MIYPLYFLGSFVHNNDQRTIGSRWSSNVFVVLPASMDHYNTFGSNSYSTCLDRELLIKLLWNYCERYRRYYPHPHYLPYEIFDIHAPIGYIVSINLDLLNYKVWNYNFKNMFTMGWPFVLMWWLWWIQVQSILKLVLTNLDLWPGDCSLT